MPNDSDCQKLSVITKQVRGAFASINIAASVENSWWQQHLFYREAKLLCQQGQENTNEYMGLFPNIVAVLLSLITQWLE
jgi:hypothetical protein